MKRDQGEFLIEVLTEIDRGDPKLNLIFFRFFFLFRLCHAPPGTILPGAGLQLEQVKEKEPFFTKIAFLICFSAKPQVPPDPRPVLRRVRPRPLRPAAALLPAVEHEGPAGLVLLLRRRRRSGRGRGAGVTALNSHYFCMHKPHNFFILLPVLYCDLCAKTHSSIVKKHTIHSLYKIWCLLPYSGFPFFYHSFFLLLIRQGNHVRNTVGSTLQMAMERRRRNKITEGKKRGQIREKTKVSTLVISAPKIPGGDLRNKKYVGWGLRKFGEKKWRKKVASALILLSFFRFFLCRIQTRKQVNFIERLRQIFLGVKKLDCFEYTLYACM